MLCAHAHLTFFRLYAKRFSVQALRSTHVLATLRAHRYQTVTIQHAYRLGKHT